MRIRTIKPEFWSHPVLCRLDDCAKLLAIGLLNLADDEGYFYADPTLVRNALMPLTEDSLRTHGALTELSRIGYIRVQDHPEHGPIGLVVNFTKHQRINRPTPSKLARYWLTEGSLRTHGGLTEDSLSPHCWNREQGKEQGKDIGDSGGAESRSVSRFKPPTIDEVRLAVAKSGMPPDKADEFFNFYTSKGWMVGKNKMKSWQSALTTWRIRWEQERSATKPAVMKNRI